MNDKENEASNKTWLGTPLSDMYGGQGPWRFSVTPVVPSKYHTVLYEIPAPLTEPPVPHYNLQPKHWEDDFVKMPYSTHSLFLVKQNGEEIIKSRWDVITESLSRPINSAEELENAIRSYNNRLPKLTALHTFFNEVLDEDDARQFFSNILPKIVKLAVSLPEVVPGSIPLLKKGGSKSVSFSQLQVACLLANAFLCTFVWRKDTSATYPAANFVRLFSADQRVTRQGCVAEKLKCIIHYFRIVTNKSPVGTITFERKFIPRNHMPRWDALDGNLGNTKIHVTSSGVIEDALGLLQVDFANKFIGGGVLGYGCVQEEIKFVICPEMIISRLFTEELGDSEAVVITGAERYSNYAGYGDSFEWNGSNKDATPFDEWGRRRTTVVVIDAMHFTRSKDQFHCSTILRELNKAYVGFSSRDEQNLAPVATGNWGCGAFKGDPHLKSLIQLMACTAAKRNLVYYSFGNTELRDDFYKMHLFLANNQVTICELWRYLCQFCAGNLPQEKLYSYIQQSHFDLKSQPTLKQFLSFNPQKRKTDIHLPSTSSADSEIKIRRDTQKATVETQSEQVVQTKQFSIKRVTSKLPDYENNSKKPINSSDIIQVMRMIDGNDIKSNSTQQSEEVVTLLSEIDKMKKAPVQGKSSESVEIPMEIDDDESPKSRSFIEDKKRKITDYFSKMTNHVNSYL